VYIEKNGNMNQKIVMCNLDKINVSQL